MTREEPWTPGPWYPWVAQGELWLKLDAESHNANGADWRLIALAPEMAELLENMVGGGYAPHTIDGRALDLLARARGEVTVS